MAGVNTTIDPNSMAAKVLKSAGMEPAQPITTDPKPALKPGDVGYVDPNPAPKPGDPNYVDPAGDDKNKGLKPGDEGYVDPNPGTKPTPKPGDPDYVAPVVVLKPGDEGYVDPNDIPDDKLLEALRKRTGNKDLKSIDEILKPKKELTPDEIKAAEEEEESNALQFGLKNKLFKKADLEAYNVDKSKSPRDLVYSLFAAEELKADDTLSEEDIQARFKSYMMEDLPEDNWMRVKRQQEMEAAAKGYMSNKYGAIEGATSQYKRYNEVIEKAGLYKNNIDSIFNELPKQFTTKIKDEDGEHPFTFNYPADIIEKAKEYYLHQDTFAELNNGNVSKEKLAASIISLINEQTLQPIIEEVAKSYFAKKAESIKMGKKGIKPEGVLGSGGASQKTDGDIPTNPMASKIVGELAPTKN